MTYRIVVQVDIDVEVDASSMDEAEVQAIRLVKERVQDGYNVVVMMISDAEGNAFRWTHRE